MYTHCQRQEWKNKKRFILNVVNMHAKEDDNYEVMDILISLIVAIILQCISNHQVAHFKYIQGLIISYTSGELEGQ